MCGHCWQVSNYLGWWRRRHSWTLLNNFRHSLTEWGWHTVFASWNETVLVLVFGSKQDVKTFPWCAWQRFNIQDGKDGDPKVPPRISPILTPNPILRNQRKSSPNDPNESKWGDSFCLNISKYVIGPFELFALLAQEEADVYGGSPSRDDDRCSRNGTGELARLFHWEFNTL